MTKREPDGLEGADPELEDLTASLLDRWQALKDAPEPDPDSATVSRLDEARARRAGPAHAAPPVAEPIQLPVREPEPEPEATPPDEGVRRPKHAALRTFPPTERATDSVTAGREVMDALGTGPTGSTGNADESPGSPEAAGTHKPRSPGSRRAPRHAAEPKKQKEKEHRISLPSLRRPEEPESPTAPPTSPPTDTSATSADASADTSTPATPWHPPSRPLAPLGDHRTSDAGRRRGPAGSASSTEPPAGRSLNVEFAPKLAARRVVGLLLIALIAATVAAGVVAYADARPLTLGAAGTLLALTLVVYAIRAGSVPTYIAIRSGQLEVVRGKTMEKFDLTSRFTRIEVVGTAGRPGWKVLLGRFGRDPLVISGSIVDPKRFMAELERYRPKE